MLSWISVAMTLTGSLVWWFGGNQQVGMAIFFAGGILWFVAQKIQSIEVRVKKAEEAQAKNKGDQPKSGANPS